jgi:hypothetical protein
MSEPPTPHTWMTRVAVASRGPRACACNQQALRPASHDLLGCARPQAHAAGRSLIC